MIFTTHIGVNASPEQAWKIVGAEFATIGDWLSVLRSSHIEGPVETGAERVCVLPNGNVSREKLLSFDPDKRRYPYQATSGIPAFIKGATNAWSVAETGPITTRVTSRAEIALKWWSLPILPLFYVGLKFTLSRVKHVLVYAIENQRPHPRVLAQKTKNAREPLSKSPENA